jgi:hypothetical protein
MPTKFPGTARLLQIIMSNMVAFRTTFLSAHRLDEKKFPLLLASGNLRFGEHGGVFGSRVETKLIRFPHLNPWCCARSRWPTGETHFWLAID